MAITEKFADEKLAKEKLAKEKLADERLMNENLADELLSDEELDKISGAGGDERTDVDPACMSEAFINGEITGGEDF